MARDDPAVPALRGLHERRRGRVDHDYRVAHRPIFSGDSRFTFARDVDHREVHSGDEPAAAVAERAELLRRQAAQDTERERERYEIVPVSAAQEAWLEALRATGADAGIWRPESLTSGRIARELATLAGMGGSR